MEAVAKRKKMFSNVPYYLVDFIVKILTLNLFVLKRLINPYRNFKHTLDLGCGVGTIAPLFIKGGYLGVDIDKNSVEYARKKNSGYKFEVADITKFKLTKKFNLVMIIGVLHHLSDRELNKVLNCTYLCLKKSGKVVIVEAIPPLYKWNLVGQFLRANDMGQFIRLTQEYQSLIEKKFRIEICRSILGGFFDYAFIVATK